MVAQRPIWEGEPRAWFGRAKKLGSEHVWFLGCCDASDVIDGGWCIISIMWGSGGNVNRLLPRMGVHVDDTKEATAGREKCLELLQDVRVWWALK